MLESRERRLPSDHLHHRSSETLLEKWRNEVGSQEQLRQNVQSVLADIFDKGEEVPVVVSSVLALRVCVCVLLLMGCLFVWV